jgi:probable rRNA maturation factor
MQTKKILRYRHKHKIEISCKKALKITLEMRKLIRKAVAAALATECFEFDALVSVTVVDGETIKNINAKHRNLYKETDVLSFPLGVQGIYDTDFSTGRKLLGDIVINMDKVYAQAEEFGHSFERELSYLTVHSVLHLLGFDHENDVASAKKMRTREEEAMRVLNLSH